MDSTLRNRLRSVIYVALRVAPKRIKQGLVERQAMKADAATAELSEAVTEAVLLSYDVAERPNLSEGAGAQYRGPKG